MRIRILFSMGALGEPEDVVYVHPVQGVFFVPGRQLLVGIGKRASDAASQDAERVSSSSRVGVALSSGLSCCYATDRRGATGSCRNGPMCGRRCRRFSVVAGSRRAVLQSPRCPPRLLSSSRGKHRSCRSSWLRSDSGWPDNCRTPLCLGSSRAGCYGRPRITRFRVLLHSGTVPVSTWATPPFIAIRPR